jgi:hypothetical protein
MGEEGQSRQIKQMVAFILQEAEEKCKEIKIKVCARAPLLHRIIYPSVHLQSNPHH